MPAEYCTVLSVLYYAVLHWPVPSSCLQLEKAICEQLILYVEKYLPKKEEAKVEASKEREVPAGMAVRRKDDDDEAALAALKVPLYRSPCH